MKSESQKKVSDMAVQGPSLALKLGHMQEWDKLLVEIVNVNNVAPRLNKSVSRIQIYARLSTGLTECTQHSPVIKDVDRSIIFELQAQPVHFQFDLSQLFSPGKGGDAFVTIDLFHVNQALWKQCVGECVVQVR